MRGLGQALGVYSLCSLIFGLALPPNVLAQNQWKNQSQAQSSFDPSRVQTSLEADLLHSLRIYLDAKEDYERRGPQGFVSHYASFPLDVQKQVLYRLRKIPVLPELELQDAKTVIVRSSPELLLEYSEDDDLRLLSINGVDFFYDQELSFEENLEHLDLLLADAFGSESFSLWDVFVPRAVANAALIAGLGALVVALLALFTGKKRKRGGTAFDSAASFAQHGGAPGSYRIKKPGSLSSRLPFSGSMPWGRNTPEGIQSRVDRYSAPARSSLIAGGSPGERRQQALFQSIREKVKTSACVKHQIAAKSPKFHGVLANAQSMVKSHCRQFSSNAAIRGVYERIVAPPGSGYNDVLANGHLGQRAGETEKERLVETYTIALSTIARESDFRQGIGVDTSARNRRNPVTVEAGMAQTSYDSGAAKKGGTMRNLFLEYLGKKDKAQGKAALDEMCMNPLAGDIPGGSFKKSPSRGSGEPLQFQELSKDCWAFANEYLAVTLRQNMRHQGPARPPSSVSIHWGKAYVSPHCRKLNTEIMDLQPNAQECAQAFPELEIPHNTQSPAPASTPNNNPAHPLFNL